MALGEGVGERKEKGERGREAGRKLSSEEVGRSGEGTGRAIR